MKIERYHIHCVIGILFMFGFGLLPPLGLITEMGMKTIGIFIGLIYLWSTVSIMWPALLGMAALVIMGCSTLNDVVAVSFGNASILVMIFILALLGVVDQNGVNDYICKWFLTRRICQKSPWLFLIFWLMAAFFIALFGNTVFSIFLLWGIFYQMAEVLQIQPYSKLSNAILLGTVVSASAGACIFPFKDMPILGLSLYQQMFPEAEMPDTMSFIIMMLIVSFATIVGYLLLIKFVFRVDVSCLKSLDISKMDTLNKLPPMTGLQKFLLGYMLIFMTFLCLPSFMPAQWTFTIILKALGPYGIAIAFFALLSMVRKDGKSIVDFQALSKDKIMWDLIFLVGAAMAVAGVLVSDSTGVKTTLSNFLTPLLAGCTPFVFLVLLLITASIVTNFSQNGVTLMLFMMAAALLAGQIDFNSATMVSLLQFCCNMAFVLPSASIMGAILHGNNNWLKTKDVYIYSMATMVVLWGIMCIIGIPLGNMLYK